MSDAREHRYLTGLRTRGQGLTGEFRLAVRGELVVGAVEFPVDVFEADAAVAVALGADVDDAAGFAARDGSLYEEGFEEMEEKEVPEVVCADLLLEALSCFAVGDGHLVVVSWLWKTFCSV
jgi:hypothetical protein